MNNALLVTIAPGNGGLIYKTLLFNSCKSTGTSDPLGKECMHVFVVKELLRPWILESSNGYPKLA